jgi:cytochrome b involved in lipid metabolism
LDHFILLKRLQLSDYNKDKSKMGTRNEKAQELDQEAIYQEDSEDFKATPQPRISRIAALLLGVITLAAIGTGVYFFLEKNNYGFKKEANQNENYQGTVSLSSMAEHDYPEDCWVAFHGNVYDMTEFAPIHPGKPSLITAHCGSDATVWFDYEHSVSQLLTAEKYLLGTLAAEDEEDELVGGTLDSSSTMSPSVSPRGDEQQATMAPAVSPVATQSSPTRTPTTGTPQTTEPPVVDGCPMEQYTLDDLSAHNDEFSCWFGLYGVVYDVTDFIDVHPGGRGYILANCGQEVTEFFQAEKKHDVDLLLKEGFSSFIIGRQGSTSGTEFVPCEEVDLVAVNLVRQ